MSKNDMLKQMIEASISNMKNVPAGVEKAQVYATLALAIAQADAGQFIEDEPVKSVSQPAASEQPQKEEAAPANIEQTSVENAIAPEDWTEEREAEFAEQIAYLKDFKECNDPGVLEQCFKDFSGQELTEEFGINPMNIVAFVHYLQILLQTSEQASA